MQAFGSAAVNLQLTWFRKKKAGFYLSADVLDRFTRKFHELKLAGVAVENKSTLLELALSFALDDLDKGTRSKVLKTLGS